MGWVRPASFRTGSCKGRSNESIENCVSLWSRLTCWVVVCWLISESHWVVRCRSSFTVELKTWWGLVWQEQWQVTEHTSIVTRCWRVLTWTHHCCSVCHSVLCPSRIVDLSSFCPISPCYHSSFLTILCYLQVHCRTFLIALNVSDHTCHYFWILAQQCKSSSFTVSTWENSPQ